MHDVIIENGGGGGVIFVSVNTRPCVNVDLFNQLNCLYTVDLLDQGQLIE